MNRTVLLPVLLLCLSITTAWSQSFTDVTASLSITHDYGYTIIGGTINQAGGVTFFDYDEDGKDDLVWSSERGDSLYILHNTGSGFASGLVGQFPKDTLESKTMQWVDYDNDGDRDLFVSNYIGAQHLYRNNGNGTFSDVTLISGITTQPLNTFTSVWGDYDKDGDLDLYLANYEFTPSGYNILYRNNGNGTFTDVTLAAGVHDPGRPALAAVFFDYDKDGWPDLYVANDRDRRNSLYRNLGNGTFQDVSVASGTDLLMWSMGCAVGDWDNNGYLDLYITNGPWGNRLLTNNGNGTFTEMGNALGVGVNKFGWGANFFDADNDGDLDLYAVATQDTINTNKARNNFYRNNGNGTWTELFNIGLEDSLNTIGTAVGDYNNDGFYDIATLGGNGDGSKLYRNTPNGNNWVKLSLEGTVSNRDGVGSWIEVRSASHNYVRYTHLGISFASQNSGTEILGIGTDGKIDTLIVTWLSGIQDTLWDVTSGATVHLVEGSSVININGTPTPVSCNGFSDGSIFTSVTGGLSGSYTYQWSPTPPTGQGTNSISNLAPGTYTLTVVDGFSHNSASFLVQEPPALNLALNVTPPTCAGVNNGNIDLAVSGGTPGYSYLWSTGSNLQDAISLDSGRYVVTVTDTLGCTQSDSVDLAYSNPMSVNWVVSDALCFGENSGSVDLTVTGGTGGNQYNWTTGDTIEDPNQLPAGTHGVVVIDQTGCISLANSITVNQPTALTLALQGADPLCNGNQNGSINLSPGGGTPGYSYLWSNGASQQNLSGIAAGTYTVTVTDSNGCTSSDSISLTDPAPVSMQLTAYPVSCAGGSDGGIDLWPSGGAGTYSYNWAHGPTTEDLTGIPAGTYSVTLTDSNGCAGQDSITVTEPAPLANTASLGDITCNGGANGSITVTASGGTPGYSFDWIHSPTTSTVSGLAAGSYSVLITDSNGCTLQDTFLLSDPPPIAAPTVTVNGDTLTSSPAATYQWFFNGNTLSGATNAILVATATGDYFVRITDSSGCTANSDTVSFMTAVQEPAISAGWRIFPNPAQGVFYLENAGTAGDWQQIKIFNSLGQHIACPVNKVANNRWSIDLRSSAAGLYWLRLSRGTGTEMIRLYRIR